MISVGLGDDVTAGLAVGVAVGVDVAISDDVAVGVALGDGDAVTQSARVILLLSRVTAPFLASTRPATVVPVCTATEVSAKMLPVNVVWVPRVAELPTCQNTLHAWAPPIRWTVLPDAVIKVEPAWKMNTALGPPFRVTVPVRLIAAAAL
jgi:hypothetical protein